MVNDYKFEEKGYYKIFSSAFSNNAKVLKIRKNEETAITKNWTLLGSISIENFGEFPLYESFYGEYFWLEKGNNRVRVYAEHRVDEFSIDYEISQNLTKCGYTNSEKEMAKSVLDNLDDKEKTKLLLEHFILKLRREVSENESGK